MKRKGGGKKVYLFDRIGLDRISANLLTLTLLNTSIMYGVKMFTTLLYRKDELI